MNFCCLLNFFSRHKNSMTILTIVHKWTELCSRAVFCNPHPSSLHSESHIPIIQMYSGVMRPYTVLAHRCPYGHFDLWSCGNQPFLCIFIRIFCVDKDSFPCNIWIKVHLIFWLKIKSGHDANMYWVLNDPSHHSILWIGLSHQTAQFLTRAK